MKLVVNTGPIIALAKIGKLALLKELAPEVFIPPTVYRELLAKFGAESEQIEQALTDFIRVTSPFLPGLRLDVQALLRGEMSRVMTVLQEGLGSPEHQAFVEELSRASSQ